MHIYVGLYARMEVLAGGGRFAGTHIHSIIWREIENLQVMIDAPEEHLVRVFAVSLRRLQVIWVSMHT